MSLVLQAGQRVRAQPVFLLQTGHFISSSPPKFLDNNLNSRREISEADSSILPLIQMFYGRTGIRACPGSFRIALLFSFSGARIVIPCFRTDRNVSPA